MQVDVQANRASRNWSYKELAGRALWTVSMPLFSLSPRHLWGWRVAMLRLFGARIGRQVHIFPSAQIAIPWNIKVGDFSAIGDRAVLYSLGPISIGTRATISQNAHICAGTHDFRSARMELLKPPVLIGDDAWVCADAFLGPGIRIGDRAIIGARAVVTKDIDADAIVAGNPAKRIGTRNINGST